MAARRRKEISVLHVDDDPDLLDLAATLLHRENDRLDVTTVPTAADCLDLLVTHDVDCIVSDYDMPGQDGIEFLETVRGAHPDLPFILFTGKGSEEIASEAISVGVSDYLQKGTGTDQYAVLAHRIENVVGKYRFEKLVNRAFRAMDSSREGIALLDERDEFIYVNDRYTDIVGYDEAELVGESWTTVYPEEQVSRIHEEVLDTVPTEGHWTGDTVYQRKDGTRIVVNHALTYSAERTMICLLRDLTDAAVETQALQEERQRFDLFIDAVEEYAIFMLDPDGYITSWNEGAKRLKGYSEDEILGEHFSTFYPAAQREAGLPDRLLGEAIEDGTAEDRGPRVQKDGSTFRAAVVITAVYDQEGQHRGFGKVTRKVTDDAA